MVCGIQEDDGIFKIAQAFAPHFVKDEPGIRKLWNTVFFKMQCAGWNTQFVN